MSTKTVNELPATPNDGLGFFEAIKLADLEGQWLRLSAQLQKRFFGGKPFGKKLVKVEDDGTVKVYWKVCFGTDWELLTLRFDSFRNIFVYASDYSPATI